MEIVEVTPPHCPEDDVVMQAVVGGWRCPECGHLRQNQDAEDLRDGGIAGDLSDRLDR